jgi:hypothetical protein
VLVVLKQINLLIIGPDLKINIILSKPAVQDFIHLKSSFQKPEGNRPFGISIAGITGNFDLKILTGHSESSRGRGEPPAIPYGNLALTGKECYGKWLPGQALFSRDPGFFKSTII